MTRILTDGASALRFEADVDPEDSRFWGITSDTGYTTWVYREQANLMIEARKQLGWVEVHSETELSVIRLVWDATRRPVRFTTIAAALGWSQEVRDALRALSRRGLVVLFRDDDTRSLTEADRECAQVFGEAPRHLCYRKRERRLRGAA